VFSIYAAMGQQTDKRRKQGRRYPLALILTYILLAKAAGETTLQAIAEWIRLRGSWLQEVLPGVRGAFPCPATYSNVLRAIDSNEPGADAIVNMQEWVYGITFLSPSQAAPQRLLSLLRAHWTIENRLHWRRDVTMREDASQVRKGCAPRALAVLNSFLLALFDWLKVRNVASQMRFFNAQPFLALSLLIRPLLTEN